MKLIVTLNGEAKDAVGPNPNGDGHPTSDDILVDTFDEPGPPQPTFGGFGLPYPTSTPAPYTPPTYGVYSKPQPTYGGYGLPYPPSTPAPYIPPTYGGYADGLEVSTFLSRCRYNNGKILQIVSRIQ